MDIRTLNNMALAAGMRIQSQRIERSYRLDGDGSVVIIVEVKVLDIDADAYVVAGRTETPTGIAKADFMAQLEAVRDESTADTQAEIDKVNALEAAR